MCVPKNDSAEDRDHCSTHKSDKDCNSDTKCMIEKPNIIMDEDWKKYNFDEALKSFKEYQLFKKICGSSDTIKPIIKEYEDKMTMDLTKNKDERETYKETNQLFNILEEYEKQSAQAQELQTSGTFSKLTKGVKNLSDKALEEDAVRKKCSGLSIKGDVGNILEGAYDVATSPVTKIAKIARTKKNDNKANNSAAGAPAANGATGATGATEASNNTKKLGEGNGSGSGQQPASGQQPTTVGGARINRSQKKKNKLHSGKFSRKKKRLFKL